MPPQYLNDRDRMLLEAWESGFQLARVLHWEGEELGDDELDAKMKTQSVICDSRLVLVGRQFSRRAFKKEEYTVYVHGEEESLQQPDGRLEPFYTETRTGRLSYDVYHYSAYFFVKSRQPCGILAIDGPEYGPCRAGRVYGARIVALRMGSPAQAAGLRIGDVIARVNGRPVDARNLYGLLHEGDNEIDYCRRTQRQVRLLRLNGASAP